LDEQPAFFPHLAQNALAFKPPLRLPGKIYLSGAASDQINLKDALMPSVSFARLYALRHKISQTQTLNRLEALVEKNALNASTRDEMAVTCELLTRLRLKRQMAALQNGETPDNLIHPGKLDHLEETLLQQAFAQVSAVQKKINYDFLGGGL
jgi:CBS domain-containing protein